MILLPAALTTAGAYAQRDGMTGINEAAETVTSYLDSDTKLTCVVGAVVGLADSIKVYSKFSSGDPDANKITAFWFGVCIFLITAVAILRSFLL